MASLSGVRPVERCADMTSKARQLADKAETERTAPLTSKLSKPDANPMLIPALLADTVRAKAMGVKDRSPEEMDELTREIKRGSKDFAKGGSASSRADGIAARGKTRGTMVMCGGGMAKGKR